MSEKLDKEMIIQIFDKVKLLEDRLNKHENNLDKVEVKMSHEMPKVIQKTSLKIIAKTEKKLFEMLKEQSTLIDKMQANYKEKLVSSREGLLQ